MRNDQRWADAILPRSGNASWGNRRSHLTDLFTSNRPLGREILGQGPPRPQPFHCRSPSVKTLL